MFGKINNKQNIKSNIYPTLNTNPKFVASPSIIGEEDLYNLIKNCYNIKNKEKLFKNSELYHEYKYKKYLNIIKLYLDEYKSNEI